MSLKFNPFTGTFDFVSSTSAGSGTGVGTLSDPYVLLNVKNVPDGKYHLIGENLESVVTENQTVTGVLIVDGVNTIL